MTKPKRPRRLSGKRTQYALGRLAGISESFMCCIKAGRRNAKDHAALNLAELTETNPRLWLIGGSTDERRAAVERWKNQGESNDRKPNGETHERSSIHHIDA